MCHPKWVGSNHTFQSADKLCSTAVLASLMRIADDPGILSVKDVPVSLWLRSDPDETTGEDDGNTVVRICTQGQDMNDTVSVRDRVSASHPVHYELCAADDKPPSLDLSVFERLLGSLTKRSSKDETSRTLPIQMLVKSPNSGGSSKNCRSRRSQPAKGYVTCIYT
jgi:hypothetical protein